MLMYVSLCGSVCMCSCICVLINVDMYVHMNGMCVYSVCGVCVFSSSRSLTVFVCIMHCDHTHPPQTSPIPLSLPQTRRSPTFTLLPGHPLFRSHEGGPQLLCVHDYSDYAVLTPSHLTNLPPSLLWFYLGL